MKKEYIGDGVYVSYDGYDLTIETERRENGRNYVILEPTVLSNLLEFIKDQDRNYEQHNNTRTEE